MFLEFFDFFCNCISGLFDTMKKFVLFRNFTYYNFLIFLLALPIIFKLVHFIFGKEDEEANFKEVGEGNYYKRYDEYKPKHAKKGSDI